MVDIDLSSLGLPWPDFLRDSHALRQEQAPLSDGQFHRGRIRFLEALLARPAIFHTDLFRDRCEAAARRNLSRHVRALRTLDAGVSPDGRR
jgi:predicted metal-dependent HD superfamily phosphohydrolase